MKGNLIVDGIDIFEEYGMTIVEGGYNGLMGFPPLKEVHFNEWFETDGIEADLSDPKLNGKTFTVKFAIIGMFSQFYSFLDLLTGKTYHDFYFKELGQGFRLRFVGESVANREFLKLGFTSLKFADDFPLKDYTYQAPLSHIPTNREYLLDDVPWTDYGVRLLEGSYDEIVRSPAVKEAMSRNVSTVQGIIYDEGIIVKHDEQGNEVTSHDGQRYKAKEAKLRMLMRAKDMGELWRNYKALLYNLTRPEERRLFVTRNECWFSFFYKSSFVRRFFIGQGAIWLEMSLNIMMTGNNGRISDEDMVLFIGDDLMLITEDGFAIDMEPQR